MSQLITINELSTCYITATYFDQNNAPYVPISVQWRLDDLTNQTNVVPWTTIVTPGFSNIITILNTSNAMTNQADLVEKRQVAVQVVAPGGAEKNDFIVYDLLNIYGVS